MENSPVPGHDVGGRGLTIRVFHILNAKASFTASGSRGRVVKYHNNISPKIPTDSCVMPSCRGEEMASHRVDIPENATIKHCREFLTEIRNAMVPGGGLEVSAEAFASGDLTTVQILLSAQKTATAVGCRFLVTQPSPSFQSLFRRAGVDSLQSSGAQEVIR